MANKPIRMCGDTKSPMFLILIDRDKTIKDDFY